jgi:hypothetical protein
VRWEGSDDDTRRDRRHKAGEGDGDDVTNNDGGQTKTGREKGGAHLAWRGAGGAS